MFNREMRIDFVKKDKTNPAPVASTPDVKDVVEGINTIFDNMFKKMTLAVVGYVVLDTGRKILVNKTNN